MTKRINTTYEIKTHFHIKKITQNFVSTKNFLALEIKRPKNSRRFCWTDKILSQNQISGIEIYTINIIKESRLGKYALKIISIFN